MAAPAAATYQAIREEAGLQHLKKVESPVGIINGVNKSFVVARTFVVDRDYNNLLGASDVVVYVNDLPVTVDSVNATTGEIVLVAAPAEGSSVKVDYAYSVLSDTSVAQYLKEATDWLKTKVRSHVDYDEYTEATYPATFTTVVKLYAAGLMLIRDYGSSADTQLSSKDGYEKIKLAKSLLQDWIDDSADDTGSNTITPTTGSMKTDGNVFPRNQDLGGTLMSPTPDTDQFFHHDN